MVILNFNEEKFSQVNSEKVVKAFFKYLKDVSKNKTELVLKGHKNQVVVEKEDGNETQDCYECAFFECSIPASTFTKVFIPTDGQKSNESEICVTISNRTIQQLVPGSIMTFKDTQVVLETFGAKASESYMITKVESEAKLDNFLGVIQEEVTSPEATLSLKEDSTLKSYIEPVASDMEASIQIQNNDLTYCQPETGTFYRVKGIEGFTSADSSVVLNLNCYLATKILTLLDYAGSVDFYVTNTKIVLEAKSEGEVLVRLVTSKYDTTFENPSDEDLESLKPSIAEATEITLNVKELRDGFKNHNNFIRAFYDSKNLESHIFKNGSGATFELSSTNGLTSKVDIHIGEVEKQDLEDTDATSWSVVLPLNLIEKLPDESNITIKYSEEENSAVEFDLGNNSLLICGKLEE